MNNIFYEFLEKNQLQGLEEVLDELPLFEELVKFPGLPAGAPQPTSVDLIGTDFNVNRVSYNFYVSSRKNKTYCFITDATMNPLDEQAQKNILVTIMKAGAAGKAISQKNIDDLKPAAHNLISPKNGENKSIVSFDLSVDTLRRVVFTYAGVFLKTIKKFEGTVANIKIGNVTPSSQSKEQQSTDMGNDAQGETEGSKKGQVANKAGENNSTTGKGTSSRRAAVSAAEKELKMQEFGKNVATARLKESDFIIKTKQIDDKSERLQKVFEHPKFAKLPNILSGIIDSIKELKNQNGFKQDFSDKLKQNKISFYTDIIKGDRGSNRKDYQRLLNLISSNIIYITPLVSKYKLFDNVNEILKAYSKDEKQIDWFYENYVNNHFTMKRIFNS